MGCFLLLKGLKTDSKEVEGGMSIEEVMERCVFVTR